MERIDITQQQGRGRTVTLVGMRVFAVLLAVMVAVQLFCASRATAHGPVSVADVAERLQDSVVNISTSQTLKTSKGIPLPEIPKGSPLDEYFDDLFDDDEQAQKKVSSLGSGFVIDKSGIIVTNNHVIEGAEEIIANFTDGTKLKVVKVLGRDPKTDLAVLKVEPKKPLTAAKFGGSARMRVGDWVMAIGNPFGLGGTVTVGIISAKSRDIHAGPYDDFIQTDAAINRGNSGGPLFDIDGNVIGVNTAIISPTGGSIGIGFAVPSDIAKPVIDQLIQFGETRRGWLGVYIRSLTEEMAETLGVRDTKGVLVGNIQNDSPASKADLKAGDIIVKFDGKNIVSKRALTRTVAGTKIGKVVEIDLIRDGKRRQVRVEIGRLLEGDRPDETKAMQPGSSGLDADQLLLGMKLSILTEKLRAHYKIGKRVKGVLVTGVEPNSVAAQKEISPGDVIVEVAKQVVKDPDDVAKRLNSVIKSGSKAQKVLLLLSDGKGALRFIAVPINKG